MLVLLAACGGGGDSPVVDGGGPSTTTAPAATPMAAGATTTIPATVLAVTVRGGSVVAGSARQRAPLNQPVTIRVTSDTADEVHVHGYDKTFAVAPGGTAETTFVASIPGVFEVEFERAGRLLFTLEVR